MIVELTCKYCGKKWERHVYTKSTLSRERCTRCGDRNLTAKDVDNSKIDYYQGSPPFVKPNEPENPPDAYYDDFGDHD